MILESQNTIYKGVYHGTRSLVEAFSTLEVEGWENIPEGACLFAANHQSMIDPPLIGSCLPREISFVARRSLFNNPVFGFVIRACHAIPLDRGQADVGAIRAALSALNEGHGLLIFPEGTRSQTGEIAEAKAGAGLLACKSGAPVVPIRIYGARDVLPRGSLFPVGNAQIRIRFGQAMAAEEYDPGSQHPERMLEASRRILNRIKDLSDCCDLGL
jgi:1-acyl-sn-glycerol-3-phosphate acyltransferase